MTTTQPYEIVGSYNNQRVSTIDAERTVNMFEYIDPLGKKPRSLINTAGLIDTAKNFTPETEGYRAQFVFKNAEYDVIGSSVFKITTNGTVSLLGTLTNTTTGYVGVDANTFQIIFVDGVNGYIYDTIADTFLPIVDQSFPATPIDVCYLDGFFTVAVGGTNNFQLSSFENGMIWGAAANNFTTDFATNDTRFIIGASTIGGLSGTTNYATGIPVQVSNSGGILPTTSPQIVVSTNYYVNKVDATHIRLATTYANSLSGPFITISNNGSGTNTITSNGQLQQASITTHPGNIVACRTLHRRLFLFSDFFTEVWENAGVGTNLPFRRNNSLLMEYGTPCLGSISVSFDIMMFLSQTRDGLGPVMQVAGTQATPISTRALDFQYSEYAAANHISDCRAFLLRINGLIFYRMNFTAANHTFVYNVSLSDPSSEQARLWHEEEILNGDRHPAQTHAYFNGINYVGSYSSPIRYQIDNLTFTNAGEIIRRMRIAKAVVPPGYQRMRIDRLQLDLLQGNITQRMRTQVEIVLETENNFFITTETGTGTNITAEQTLPLDAPIIPEVYLSISKDGGQTYGYIIRAPMGNIGRRTFRTLWRKLGVIPRGQAFVPKIEFFEPVPFVILGASWAVDQLPE